VTQLSCLALPEQTRQTIPEDFFHEQSPQNIGLFISIPGSFQFCLFATGARAEGAIGDFARTISDFV
jgi:hypothetical protein